MAYHETVWADQTYTSFALQTAHTDLRRHQVLVAVNTRATPWTATRAATPPYAGGRYTNGSWSLSSYNLTATTSLTAQQTQASGGSSTASGLNTAGQNYTSASSNSFSQGTFQSQSGTVTEQGTYGGGSYALAETLDFTAQGSDSFNSGSKSGDAYTGSTSGNDSSWRRGRPGQLVGVGVAGAFGVVAVGSAVAVVLHVRRRLDGELRPAFVGPGGDDLLRPRRRLGGDDDAGRGGDVRRLRRGRDEPDRPDGLVLLRLRRLDHLGGDAVRLLRRRQRRRLRQRRRDGDGLGRGRRDRGRERRDGLGVL